jgi:diguanylate cyclase (GGDEF)-like protein
VLSLLVLDLTDPLWRVIACSERVCRLTRMDRSELIGRPWPALWDADVHAKELAALREAIEHGNECRVEMATVPGDGEPVASTVTVHPGEDEHGAVAIIHVETELDDDRRLAYHDALTGLPNRRMLERELDIALTRALRQRRSVALLFVDLDDFKPINDELGHSAGDDALRQTAERLVSAVRNEDLVVRLGGDEFVIVITDIEGPPRERAYAVAEHIGAALDCPLALGQESRLVSASIGISLFPDDAPDLGRLLDVADAAMYRSKRRRPGEKHRDVAAARWTLLDRARQAQRRAAELRTASDAALATAATVHRSRRPETQPPSI